MFWVCSGDVTGVFRVCSGYVPGGAVPVSNIFNAVKAGRAVRAVKIVKAVKTVKTVKATQASYDMNITHGLMYEPS